MDVTLIVCAYAMSRELPRTIYSLSRDYQRGLADIEYEILVVDNGSPEPVNEAALRRIAPNLRVLQTRPAPQSPVKAINAAAEASDSRMLGVFIDGARVASPGLIARALDAYESDSTKVIGTLGFHLGPDVQMRSFFAGYNQAVEDQLLSTIPWRENGYTLFHISVLAGSSTEGWFGCISESNGVFLDRRMWRALGGFDERFGAPGGGVVNLDFWERAVSASGYRPWIILGEATFHQVHGGAATNGTEAARAQMFDEYRQIRGRDFVTPRYRPQFVGCLNEEVMRAGYVLRSELEALYARIAVFEASRSWRITAPLRAIAGALRWISG
jgi:glycosyltransferase involved in cell wall biosynthesis